MARHTTSHRTRTVPGLLLLAGLVALQPPTAADAQMRGPEAMSPGDRVRVRLRSDGEVNGRLVRMDEAGLVLEADRRLPAAAIDQIWIRRDRIRPFAIGGAIGGGLAVGGLFGLFVHAICETPSCTDSTVKATLAGAAVGAAGGALVGALVGAIASSWEEIDPGFGSGAPDWSRRLDVVIAPVPGESGPGLAVGLSLPAPR